ncbi:hypothetical protein Micbo1qcDRAFT_165610, partial [Microdochium bolleyi]
MLTDRSHLRDLDPFGMRIRHREIFNDLSDRRHVFSFETSPEQRTFLLTTRTSVPVLYRPGHWTKRSATRPLTLITNPKHKKAKRVAWFLDSLLPTHRITEKTWMDFLHGPFSFGEFPVLVLISVSCFSVLASEELRCLCKTARRLSRTIPFPFPFTIPPCPLSPSIHKFTIHDSRFGPARS